MISKIKPYYNLKEIKQTLFNLDKDIINKFEEKFAKKTNSKFAISSAYGRTSLFSFLTTQNIKKQNIAIPAFTCIVVPNTIIRSNNNPLFIDISLKDYNMDLNKNKESQTTKIIMATHMYGYPMNIKKIKESSKVKDQIIIEDACLAPLAKDVGKHSDCCFYSLNINKHMCCFDGGMLTTNNQETYQKVKAFQSKNFKKTSILNKQRKKLWFIVSYCFFNNIPYSLIYRLYNNSKIFRKKISNWNIEKINMPKDFKTLLTKFQARLGLAQLEKLEKNIEKRKAIVKVYDKTIKNNNIIKPPLIKGAVYSHYTIRIKNRENLIKYLEKKGIGIGRSFDFDYSIPSLKIYNKYNQNNKNYPNSNIAAKQVVNLPIRANLKLKQAMFVSNCLNEYTVSN